MPDWEEMLETVYTPERFMVYRANGNDPVNRRERADIGKLLVRKGTKWLTQKKKENHTKEMLMIFFFNLVLSKKPTYKVEWKFIIEKKVRIFLEHPVIKRNNVPLYSHILWYIHWKIYKSRHIAI